MSGRGADGQPTLLHVGAGSEIVAALDVALVPRGRPVVVLVGGAGGMDRDGIDELEAVLRRAVVPVVDASRAVVVDGGTDSGVMRAIGRARASTGAVFPLVGVAARGTVAVGAVGSDKAALDPNHTHVVLVPGTAWGDEASWLAEVADAIARDRRSVTLLANGGEIAYQDAENSLARGRPVVVLARSGRTADAIANAAVHDGPNARAQQIAGSPLTRIIDLGDAAGLQAALEEALSVTEGSTGARKR